MFTAVFVSRTLFEFILSRRQHAAVAEHLVEPAMQIFSNTHYDFIKWRWHAIVLSRRSSSPARVMVVQRGLPLGIDFSGGTIVVFQFDSAVGEDAVRKAIEPACRGEKVVQQYGKPEDHSVLVRLPQAPGVEEGFDLEKDAKALERRAVKAANLGRSRKSAARSSARPSARTCSSKGLWRRCSRSWASRPTSRCASA